MKSGHMKNSAIYCCIDGLDILIDNMIIIVMDYASNFEEKYIGQLGNDCYHGYNPFVNNVVYEPMGVTVSQNEIFVVDRYNYKVKVFDQKNEY